MARRQSIRAVRARLSLIPSLRCLMTRRIEIGAIARPRIKASEIRRLNVKNCVRPCVRLSAPGREAKREDNAEASENGTAARSDGALQPFAAYLPLSRISADYWRRRSGDQPMRTRSAWGVCSLRSFAASS
ncbi:hypothetical protein MPC1_5570003 [Methylocella tundrae]|nr:hypothetical protein MPC1_5570003 [Methylocella tundrae]